MDHVISAQLQLLLRIVALFPRVLQQGPELIAGVKRVIAARTRLRPQGILTATKAVNLA